MINNMSYKQAAQDGPVMTKKLEEMTAVERRGIDNLIKRAYIRHGFVLAHEYDDYVLCGKKHDCPAAFTQSIPDNAPYSNPITGYDVPDILNRLRQAGRPLSKVAIV